LGPTDIFSAGCRPSQTARLLLSSIELVTIQKISSITLVLHLDQNQDIDAPTYAMYLQ